MNCHECTHMRTIPGDAHVRCKCKTADNFTMAALLASASGKAITRFPGIEINETGARNGWAMWPVNFDPIWIRRCKHFELLNQPTGAKNE